MCSSDLLEAATNIAEANRAWNDNLFDLANNIDSLRKGTLEEADVAGLQEQTRKIKDSMIGAAINEARARRAEAGAAELTQAETDSAVEQLDKQFSHLIDVAPESAIVKKPGEPKAGPTLLQKKFEEKGYPIKRGMTMGPSERTEFAKLRRDIEAVINKLAPQVKEKKAAPVVEKGGQKPAPVKVEPPQVTLKAVGDAIGVLKTDARFSIYETRNAKAAATEAINKGLQEGKSTADILKAVQAATKNGLTAKGIKGIKDLLASVSVKERTTRKEKMEAQIGRAHV